MEIEKWYRANFDYEYDLYDIPISFKQRLKICREFEYLYFYTPLDGGLILHGNLSKNFLQTCPYLHPVRQYQQNKHKKYENLWGSLTDVEVERHINSKLFSLELENKLALNKCNKQLITNENELNSYCQNNILAEKILQSPYLFSGLQQKQFVEAVPIQIDYPVIASCRLNRIFDIGTVVQDGKRQYSYLNLNNKLGKYRGTIFFKSDNLFKEFVCSYYRLKVGDIDHIFSDLADSIEKLINIVDVHSFQVDSFTFDNGTCLDLYPLVEINYRTTLGSLAFMISRDFNSKYIAMRIIPAKKGRTATYNRLSPDGNLFDLFLEGFDSTSELFHYLDYFNKYDPI